MKSYTRMDAQAVIFNAPKAIALRHMALPAPAPGDVVVDVEVSGISTGTERLLWSGAMPPFPGLGYPLVPGYESVGHVVEITPGVSHLAVGDRVFVPGASCFTDVRCLFGGTASRLVVPATRAIPVPDGLGDDAALLALLATAHHALVLGDAPSPDLVVGHGVLGRLLARLVTARGHDVAVWEKSPARAAGSRGYRVLSPEDDPRRDYRRIIDVSGDSAILDTLVGRLARGGEVVLAGFYAEPLKLTFPPAFMKEAHVRVAAEWQKSDLDAVTRLLASGAIPLDGLVTHRMRAHEAAAAYEIAFHDPACLKMLIAWTDRGSSGERPPTSDRSAQ